MAKTRKPRQQRAKQTVADIIEAGFIVVAREGVEGLTTRKVADMAGVSVGTLYEYFANKDEILEAIQGQFADDVVAMIRPLIPELVQSPPREVVLRLQFALRDLLQRNKGRYLATARALGGNFSGAHLEPVRRVLGELATQYLTHNPELARLPDIPTKAYIMIHGGIATMVQQLSEENPTVSFEQLSEGLADMVRYMIEGGLAEAEA
jgi:AcrR family transcriptional regulator